MISFLYLRFLTGRFVMKNKFNMGDSMNIRYQFLLLCLFLSAVISGCSSVDTTASTAARQSLRDAQTPFSNAAFVRSIIDGDTEKVALFLKGGITSLNKGDKSSDPLTIAVQNNRDEIVEMLLKDENIDVDVETYLGTPLCVAASNGDLNIGEMLIAKGADVDYLYGSGAPLIFAAGTGRNEMVTLLLSKGADINIQTEVTGMTPLIAAAKNGHASTVKLLLDNGADLNVNDKRDMNALIYPVFFGHNDVLNLILEDKSYTSSEDSVAALAMAISMKHPEMAKEIIKKGADINALYGDIPLLSWAIANNHTEGVDILLEAGADTTKEDKAGMTPLDYALTAGNQTIIDELRSKK